MALSKTAVYNSFVFQFFKTVIVLEYAQLTFTAQLVQPKDTVYIQQYIMHVYIFTN